MSKDYQPINSVKEIPKLSPIEHCEKCKWYDECNFNYDENRELCRNGIMFKEFPPSFTPSPCPPKLSKEESNATMPKNGISSTEEIAKDIIEVLAKHKCPIEKVWFAMK